jgi:hypothetical protein
MGERYRIIDHIQKHHYALDEAAFYCNLCMFRCATNDQLEKHVTSYKRHALIAVSRGGAINDKRFLVRNPNPRSVVEGVDYTPATPEASLDPTSSILDIDLDDMADAPLASVSGTNGQNLVSVQMSPAMLSSLLSTRGDAMSACKGGAFQPIERFSTAPGVSQMQYDPLRPTYSGTASRDILAEAFASTIGGRPQPKKPCSAPQTSTAVVRESPLEYVPTSLPVTVTPRSVVQQHVSTPELRIPFVDSCDVAPETRTPVAPRITSSPLHTPVMDTLSAGGASPDAVNLLPQMLGDLGDDYPFSPPNERAAPKVLMDKSCQTISTGQAVAEQYAPLTAALSHIERTLESSLSKLVFAVESVARATRHNGQILESLESAGKAHTRALERLTQELREMKKKGHQEETVPQKRARLEENKENRNGGKKK